jgi:hypothetical protein
MFRPAENFRGANNMACLNREKSQNSAGQNSGDGVMWKYVLLDLGRERKRERGGSGRDVADHGGEGMGHSVDKTRYLQRNEHFPAPS